MTGRIHVESTSQRQAGNVGRRRHIDTRITRRPETGTAGDKRASAVDIETPRTHTLKSESARKRSVAPTQRRPKGRFGQKASLSKHAHLPAVWPPSPNVV